MTENASGVPASEEAVPDAGEVPNTSSDSAATPDRAPEETSTGETEAAAEHEPVPVEEAIRIEDLSLEDLLGGNVTAVTGAEQRVEEAPAVVTVINRPELIQAGYRTVAEALEMVPGFAVNTDHVFYNVGVRGISGGIRGGSRQLRVMVDGIPVAFLPDAWNFLGPEFLPLGAIERIEVIRGPGSAVYGANAFLGVINVVTRDPRTSGGGGLVSGEAGLRGERFTGGGEMMLSANEELFDVLVSARTLYSDRSGLILPQSSPSLSLYGDTQSHSDTSQPASVYGRLGLHLGDAGDLGLQMGYQHIDANSQYADTGALSNRTRVQLDNFYGRLRHQFTHEWFSATSYVGLNAGGPGAADEVLPTINGRSSGELVRRDFGYLAVTAGVSTGFTFSRSQLTVGTEYQYDDENIRTNIFRSRGSDASVRGPDFGNVGFENFGAYTQLMIGEIDRVSLSGNIRYDVSNQFGDSFNYRVGGVWSITDEFYLKVLSGSSFRGPTPEQFYGTPMFPGDIQGSRSAAEPFGLNPARAFTHELAAGYSSGEFHILLNGYVTNISNRIEYIPSSGNLQVGNLADSLTIGGEADFRCAFRNVLDVLDVTGSINGAVQSTSFDVSDAYTPRQRALLRINEIFPTWTLSWMLNLTMRRYFVSLTARMPILGPRLQSQTNQLIGRPFEGDALHSIAVSAPLHINLSTVGLHLIGDQETRFQLTIYNVLETASEDPGWNGINVPALGRQVFLSIAQEFR